MSDFEIVDFLRNKTFYLATVKDNMPMLRPFGAIMQFENKIYFVTSTTKEVYKQILKNPNVCLCACDENRKWVRINGTAKQDDRKIAKQKMLDENPILLERKRYKNADDKTMAIFYIDNMTAQFN